MAVGLIAAILVARLCYVRFRGYQLDDKAAVPETAGATSQAKPAPLAR
jgi:hypothetical protein